MTETVTEARDRFFIWLNVGVSEGWIAPPDCQTHNPVPLREWEEMEFENGFDPCVVVARIWMDGYE